MIRSKSTKLPLFAWVLALTMIVTAVLTWAAITFLASISHNEAASRPPMKPVAVSFDDTTTVRLQPVVTTGAPLRAPVSGTLTRFECTPAERIQTGTSIVSIDGQSLVTMSTDEPIWRDLELGDQGDDVVAFSDALVNEGQLEKTKSAVDGELLSAWEEFASRVTTPTPQMVSRANIFWAHSGSRQITECAAQLGQLVSEGEVLAQTLPTLTSIEVELPRSYDPSAAYVLEYAGVSAPIAVEGMIGRVDDRKLLDQVAEDHDFKSWVSDSDANPIPATVRRQTPLSAYQVPADYVGSVGSCNYLQAAGETTPVRVLAARLGMVFIIAQDDPDLNLAQRNIEVVDSNPNPADPCGR